LKKGLVYSFDKFQYGFNNVEFVDSGRHFIVNDMAEAIYFNTKTSESAQFFDYIKESQGIKNVSGVIAVNDRLKRFYLVMADNIIREYRIDAGKAVLSQMFTGQTQALNFASVSDGHLILGDGAGYVKMFNLIKGEPVNYYNAHSEFMSGVSYSFSKQLIATGSWDNSVKTWSTVTNKQVKKMIKKHPVTTVRINNTNDRMVLITKEDVESFEENINSSIEVIDLKTYATIKKINSRDRVISARFSNDGSLVFYCNQTDSTVNICDQDLKISRKLKATGWIHDAYQGENGQFILAVTQTSVDLFGFQTNQLIRSFAIENGNGSNSAAITKDGSILAAGTGRGNIKFWDVNSGKLLFTQNLHSSGLIPIFTNEKELMTCSEDGTVKYWKFDRSGIYPVYQMVPFKKNEYITVIPAGYYKGSRDAAKLLHYVTKDLKVISFEQLDVKYNRPDKVLEATGSTDTALIRSYRKAYEKRIKKLGIDTTAFRPGYSVPEADLANREYIEYGQKQKKLQLDIKAVDSSYKLDRFNVWINEIPVFGQRGISIRDKNINSFDSTISIDLSRGENRIETSVINVNGTESYRVPLLVNYAPAVKQKEQAYFIGIGIDKFADNKYNLKFSTKDIRDLAKKLKAKYKDIIIDTLFNEAVTISGIKALKQKLLQTKADDKVIISYSGHGILSKDFDYYLSTYAVNFDRPEENGLPYDELESLLDSIPARKKLMLIDACHSGEVDKDDLLALNATNKKLIKGLKPVAYKKEGQLGLKNSFELMQELFVNVGKSTGAMIISAAAGTEFALEGVNNLPNGVFTYSILEAMNTYPSMKISELKKTVGERVVQLTNGLQKPTSRNETIAVDWQIW
jgi:WD40 repeat protein